MQLNIDLIHFSLMGTAMLWQFVVHKNGAGEIWTWRRARLDGKPLEVSADAHASYGKVINDAIKHGFRPRQEPWVVTDGASITHFSPCRDVPPARKRKKPKLAREKKLPAHRASVEKPS